MAEYTIPKPYRDFYVTNPYIELKESNERLQKIVKSGYVATDSFEGAANQVITFDSPKHGFSLTNDSSKAGSWSVNLNDVSLWEQGIFVNTTGAYFDSTNRIRTTDFYPIMPGANYTFSCTATTGTYQIAIFQYDENQKFISWLNFSSFPYSPTNINANTRFVKFGLRNSEESDITPSSVFTDITAITFSVSSYTAPSDVTVKVAENVAGLPTTADGWEQGSLQTTSGNPATSTTVIRTKGFIDVNGDKQYTFKANSSVAYKGSVYEYKEDGSFILTNGLTSLPFSVSLSKDTRKIKLLLYKGTYPDPILPSDIFSELSFPRLVGDEMIVQSDDTRIVTMPPFTSLYIESNVPYHGHTLDLAE